MTQTKSGISNWKPISVFCKYSPHRGWRWTSVQLHPCELGVLQGWVLGLLLFATYVSPVQVIAVSACFGFHQYANGTQIYFVLRSNIISQDLQTCTNHLQAWFVSSWLMLNLDKSESLLIGTYQQFRSVAAVQTVPVAVVDLPIKRELKSLGVTLDEHFSFNSHVSQVCQACNYCLHALSLIRSLMSVERAQTLACSKICSCMDYCNAVLHGIHVTTLSKLQHVQNNIARVVLRVPKRTHALPLLHQLHWLLVELRITYKLAVLIFQTRQHSSLKYLHELLVTRSCTRKRHSANRLLLEIPQDSYCIRLSFVPFVLLCHIYGILFPLTPLPAVWLILLKTLENPCSWCCF
jgi:hypothetical protein